MSVLFTILIWIGYHLLNIILGVWNAEIVKRRISNGNPKQIEHFWWALGYLALCVPQYFLVNIWFAISVLSLHLSVFPVAYNIHRDLPPFNLSKTSKAVTDKLMVQIGLKSTEIVNITVFIASGILLIKSF